MTETRVGQLLDPRLLPVLWVTVGIGVAGQLLDLRWHLTHDEFETASDQLQAHWLSWIDALALLVVSSWGARSRRGRPSRPAYLVVAVAVGAYLLAAAWHFAEHAGGSDPVAAHVVIATAKLSVVAGAIAVTALERGRRYESA